MNLFVLFFIIGVCMLIVYNMILNRLVFHPPKTLMNEDGIKYLKSKNGNIITYYIEYANVNKKPTDNIIIWSHGNACSAINVHSNMNHLAQVINCDIIIYDYQGYGLSEGSPTEQNCYDDLESIINHTKSKYMYEKIYLVGHSLGTGIVVDYAFKNKWKVDIILISPYRSILHVIDNMPIFNFISNPKIQSLIKHIDMFRSIDKINKLKCPVKIYHGLDDELILPQHGIDLSNKVDNKKHEITLINNCKHNDILSKINWSDVRQLCSSSS